MRAARTSSGDQPDRVAERTRRPRVEAPRAVALERDVVVARGGRAVSGRRAGRLEVARVGRDVRPRGEAVAAAPAHAGVVAAAEELDRVGHDLDVLAVVALLVLPLAPLQGTVDRHRADLGEEAGAVLALRAPDRDVEVVGLVLPVARGLVLATRVAGDPQRAHRGASAGGPELGVTREVACNDDPIDVGGGHDGP